ncbi:hypothetical protein LTR95_017539, partial [Oleoguttula sp. CCFEE 5521]
MRRVQDTEAVSVLMRGKVHQGILKSRQDAEKELQDRIDELLPERDELYDKVISLRPLRAQTGLTDQNSDLCTRTAKALQLLRRLQQQRAGMFSAESPRPAEEPSIKRRKGWAIAEGAEGDATPHMPTGSPGRAINPLPIRTLSWNVPPHLTSSSTPSISEDPAFTLRDALLSFALPQSTLPWITLPQSAPQQPAP